MAKCPTCREEVKKDQEFWPFCSSRCKEIDLGKWFNESYRIPRAMNGEEWGRVLADLADEN